MKTTKSNRKGLFIYHLLAFGYIHMHTLLCYSSFLFGALGGRFVLRSSVLLCLLLFLLDLLHDRLQRHCRQRSQCRLATRELEEPQVGVRQPLAGHPVEHEDGACRRRDRRVRRRKARQVKQLVRFHLERGDVGVLFLQIVDDGLILVDKVGVLAALRRVERVGGGVQAGLNGALCDARLELVNKLF